MLHSLRYAIQRLWKSPGFTLAATVTLALGIGTTTAMFSLVDAVLLRPLPFPNRTGWVWIQYDDAALGGNGTEAFSYPNFFNYRREQHSFNAIASYRSSGNTLIGAGDAQQLETEIVSAEFFRVLGASPALGRDFSARDEKRNVRDVVLSWELWQRAFGGRRETVGAAINLDGRQYEVAGVMPAGFSFPIRTPGRALWISLAEDVGEKGAMQDQRGAGVLNLIGRLKPGVSLSTARADIQVVASNLTTQYPKDNRQLTRIIVMAELEHIIGDTKRVLRVLFAAVAAVLLIGSVNVAGLLLARAGA